MPPVKVSCSNSDCINTKIRNGFVLKLEEIQLFKRRTSLNSGLGETAFALYICPDCGEQSRTNVGQINLQKLEEAGLRPIIVPSEMEEAEDKRDITADEAIDLVTKLEATSEDDLFTAITGISN